MFVRSGCCIEAYKKEPTQQRRGGCKSKHFIFRRQKTLLSGSVLGRGKFAHNPIRSLLLIYVGMQVWKSEKENVFFSFRMRHLLCKTVYSEISKWVCVWFIFLPMRGKRLKGVGVHKTIAEKRRVRIIVPFLYLFIANRVIFLPMKVNI